jgi:hypothetical protein
MEEIKRIGENVLKQVEYEKEQYSLQYAQMRVDAMFNGSPKILWLYNKETPKRSVEKRDFLGNITGTELYETSPERVQIDSGSAVSKNSKLGGELIKNRCKDFSYHAPRGEFKVSPKNLTIYRPDISKVDAKNGEIEVKGKDLFRFKSLKQLLKQYKVQSEKEHLRKRLEEEKEVEKAAVLQQQILELEEEIVSEIEQQQRYIRESTELRMQPILDPEQETIKRSKILDGMLIIDGGPGTGKTTTLIQRINFLTDVTIGQYREDLSDDAINNLEGNWRFFSPSRLLKQFLKNSMDSEGLNTNDQYTKVWSDYLNEVFKKYTLFNPATQNPFIKAHGFTESVFPTESKLIQSLFDKLNKAVLDDIKKRLKRVIDSDIDGVSWSKKGENLKQKAKSALQKNTLEDFVKLFEDWKKSERDQVKDELEDLNVKLSRLAARIELRVKEKAPEVYKKITNHLKERYESRFDIEADEEEEEDFDTEETAVQSFNPQIERSRFFRQLTSAKALRTLNKGFRKRKILKDWKDDLEFAFDNIELTEIGELTYFRTFTNNLIAGAGTAVFGRIPIVYKQIRSEIVNLLDEQGYENEKFGALVKKERKRIHTDEMNLILWFINQTIKNLRTKSPITYDQLDHNYVSGFKEEVRSVIAIDEATDFSPLEIAAISSFSDPRYNSVTLSGDLMQRMTASGIDNWKALDHLFPQVQVERLTISYRQSSTLLELASKLYENVTGVKPDFKAYIPKSKAEPQPVIVKKDSDDDVSDWLESQIIKVYTMYGNKIPSVAIFAESDVAVTKLAKVLQNSDRLLDVGITVRYSTSDSELVPDSQVCVFNIKNIKGLEFEAVFFANIDCLDVHDNELLQKYLYVGLSRAAYYLGVSYKYDLPESLRFLEGE